jgi:protein tyrosine/serine phosphatase
VLISGLLSCQYSAGPIPLGATNDSRKVQSAVAERWAEPVEARGLPNLHKVSDSLYRSAQPTAEGWQQLQKLGIKTVINLRSTPNDPEALKGANLTGYEIPMIAWQPPTQGEIIQFLHIVTDSSHTPALVHCRRGADRTGVMCAIYRIVVQGWSKDEAIAEMTRGGFGFYSGWQNLVRYIRDLNVDELRRQIAPAVTPVPAAG